MPGLDGTGPLGDGQPGRGLGPCNNKSKVTDKFNQRSYFRRGRRRRRGRRK